MKKLRSTTLLLIAGISVIGLTGCEQIEQAASQVVEKAKTSAVQVLDEAAKAGSIEQVTQSANQALQDIKQDAAGLLGQAGEYLSDQPQESDTIDKSAIDPAPAI